MRIIHGKGVSGGVAIGEARLLKKEHICVEDRAVDDPDAEWSRYEEALARTVTELEQLSAWSMGELGQGGAQLFEVHAMMARDEDFNEAVRSVILTRRKNAEYAVNEAAGQIASVFASMEDAYMRERATDMRDIAERILRHLVGGSERATVSADEHGGGMGDILCAYDLTPSETVQLDRSRVRAFVTGGGATNSHTAILSRTMGLPAVVRVGEALEHIRDGMLLAVDADEGLIYLEPDEATLDRLRGRMEDGARARAALGQYRDRESRTADGRLIEVCANIGRVEDVREARAVGAEGIGLFRSEFLYMGRNDLPDEEEQFAAYRQVLTEMAGRRVVVRTLDIGADKQAAGLSLPPEDNPALGLRAIRISLSRPDLFLTQARALLRASCYGRLAVMFPLVVSEREVVELRALWEQAADELRERGIPFAKEVEIGIMIETPAAALISDRLASMVDFFSIGTNDLTQYTLALDRQNAALDRFCDTHHEAILRLIRFAVDSAHRAGIWVGVCGELAADPTMTEALLRMGVDELSVAPSAVLSVRERVCRTHLGERAPVQMMKGSVLE
ncbi:MAG: phosphoenolpyruvate--protein phosphotransferase [Clostridia bacterium]|nr:phosphoenolpyruvate--protein phosphotransferase [Clostridia bacterium]